ncbi:MAG: hypothetical protein HQL71_05145 [Magnetococcales bacterium]|nr:hypothetical protein [Magnetococcales bacterium]
MNFNCKKSYIFIAVCGLVLLFSISLSPSLALANKSQSNVYRQPAYVSNAYFSDKVAKVGELIQPLTVIKALKNRSVGEVGYFIMDLILTHDGRHQFKVNILNKSGEKVSELNYPKVSAPKDSPYPLFTAVGSISNKIPTDEIWFFKVYDRVNGGIWHRLGTFAISISPQKKIN